MNKIVAASAAFLLSGCAHPSLVCQDVKTWSRNDQVEMAFDLSKLPVNSPVRNAMIDYAKMREEARACQKVMVR